LLFGKEEKSVLVKSSVGPEGEKSTLHESSQQGDVDTHSKEKTLPQEFPPEIRVGRFNA